MSVKTVGVLGGGQLGQMLALAGIPLGLRFRFLDSSPDAPAASAGKLIVGPFDDRATLATFAQGADVVTYEFENVPAASVEILEPIVQAHPPRAALSTAQDRLREKEIFTRLGVPTTRFVPVNSEPELRDALKATGLPAFLKTRRLGYDGKGQAVIRAESDISGAWTAMNGAASIVENMVAFTREISILAVRSRGGECAFYPLVQNEHRGGILRVSRAPAPDITPELERATDDAARRVLDALDYVGVLGIEFFAVHGASGRETLLANEMAPRVHNSGHWTIEGAACSQFENHVRAVCGLPLGDPSPRGVSIMLNIIGDAPPAESVLRVPGARLHLYGKSPARGRKLGHITITAPDWREADRTLGELQTSLAQAGWKNSDAAAIG